METTTYNYIQLALVAGAWCLFAPLGLTIVLHRKWFQYQFIGLRMWFHLHRLFMIFAVCAYYTGVGIYFVVVKDTLVMNTMQEVYQWMMVAVGGMLLFQLTGTLLRPPQTHEKRTLWNSVHRLSGIVVLCSGIALVYIGVYIMVEYMGESYYLWIVPMSSCLFIILILNILIPCFRSKETLEDIEENKNENMNEFPVMTENTDTNIA